MSVEKDICMKGYYFYDFIIEKLFNVKQFFFQHYTIIDIHILISLKTRDIFYTHTYTHAHIYILNLCKSILPLVNFFIKY